MLRALKSVAGASFLTQLGGGVVFLRADPLKATGDAPEVGREEHTCRKPCYVPNRQCAPRGLIMCLQNPSSIGLQRPGQSSEHDHFAQDFLL